MYGDTALHDAIGKDSYQVIDLLCSAPGDYANYAQLARTTLILSSSCRHRFYDQEQARLQRSSPRCAQGQELGHVHDPDEGQAAGGREEGRRILRSTPGRAKRAQRRRCHACSSRASGH